MELTEIERQAKALMTVHGVGYLEFAFDRGKRRLGATHILKIGNASIPQKITLSKHYAVLLGMDELRDVILHEIAHALTPGHGHNAVWKAAARKIGAKPERCAAPSAAPEHPIVGYCTKDGCGKVVVKMHRLPLRVSYHRTCGRDFPLRYTKNGNTVTLNSMPTRYRAEYNRSYLK